MMEFTHHPREEGWRFDPTRQYQQSVDPTMKPRGFWLGVDGDWKRWVEEEEMDWTEKPAVHFEVDLDKVLVLGTSEDLLLFNEQNRASPYGDRRYSEYLYHIDWGPTVSNYGGIVIAPHHWEVRLDIGLLWYSTWDCASACVWDLSTIKEKVST